MQMKESKGEYVNEDPLPRFDVEDSKDEEFEGATMSGQVERLQNSDTVP